MKFLWIVLIAASFALASNLKPEKSDTTGTAAVELSDYEQITAAVILLEEYNELSQEEKSSYYTSLLDSFSISHDEYQGYLRKQREDVKGWYNTVDRIYNALFQEK